MAWTAPRTWVSSEVPTAAIMNAHIRDNLLVQDANAAQLPADIIYAGGANNMTERATINQVQGHEGSHLTATATGMTWQGPSLGFKPAYASNGGTYSTGSTSLLDLSDCGYNGALGFSGPSVEVLLVTGTQVLVMYGARFCTHETLGQNCQMSYRISGGTAIGASTSWGTVQEADPALTVRSVWRANYHTGLTAGSNTFILNMASSGGATATVGGPWIAVKAL